VEEVQILREEMKRTLRMLGWIQGVWEKRAAQRSSIDAELAAGLKAYAARQASVHRRIAEGFHKGWNRSVATAVRDVMRQDGTVYRDLLEGELDSAPALGLEEIERAVSAEVWGRRRWGGGNSRRQGCVGAAACRGDRCKCGYACGGVGRIGVRNVNLIVLVNFLFR
jgi:hypothetical protein